MSIRPDPRPHRRIRQAGISLIELVMFIIIVGVGVAGILSLITTTTRSSTDPMLRKQAIAIAEALMEEIQQQPFTYCDPNDPQAATATGPVVNPLTGCSAGMVEAYGVPGAEAGQTRYSVTTPFNNVNDYGAVGGSGVANVLLPAPPGILGLDGVQIPGLAGYSATVTITDDGIGGVPAVRSLRIDVRVQNGTAVDITLTGYRLQYAPNAVS